MAGRTGVGNLRRPWTAAEGGGHHLWSASGMSLRRITRCRQWLTMTSEGPTWGRACAMVAAAG